MELASQTDSPARSAGSERPVLIECSAMNVNSFITPRT